MKNALRGMYETDTKAEKEGIWLQYAPEVEIRIARAGGANKRFAKILSRLAKPHRRAIQTESINEDVLKDIFITAYAQAVIIDWKGFTKDLITHVDEDGAVELPFNLDNCVAVLKNQPNLFADIQKSADDISLFRAMTLEADSKN